MSFDFTNMFRLNAQKQPDGSERELWIDREGTNLPLQALLPLTAWKQTVAGLRMAGWRRKPKTKVKVQPPVRPCCA